MNPLLSISDLAARWNCSKRTVRRIAHSGRIGHIRIGSRLRFSVEQVQEYESRRTRTMDQPTLKKLLDEISERTLKNRKH